MDEWDGRSQARKASGELFRVTGGLTRFSPRLCFIRIDTGVAERVPGRGWMPGNHIGISIKYNWPPKQMVSEV